MDIGMNFITKSDINSVSDNFFLDECNTIKLLKKAYIDTYYKGKRNVDIIAFDFKKKRVFIKDNNQIITKFIGDTRKTTRGRELESSFKKMLIIEANKKIKNSGIFLNRLIDKLFNGNRIVDIHLKGYDDNYCYFYIKLRGKKIDIFDFRCKISSMFDSDKLNNDYRFFAYINKIKVIKNGYLIDVTRKHKEVINYEIKFMINLLIKKFFSDDEEIKKEFLNSFRLVGIDRDKGIIRVNILDNSYFKQLKMVFSMIENQKPYVKFIFFSRSKNE